MRFHFVVLLSSLEKYLYKKKRRGVRSIRGGGDAPKAALTGDVEDYSKLAAMLDKAASLAAALKPKP